MSDEFEKKIREKLNSATPEDVPFDEAAWNKMEQKLDALNNGNRRGFAWWWLGALLLLTGIGGLLWKNNTADRNIPVPVEKPLTTGSSDVLHNNNVPGNKPALPQHNHKVSPVPVDKPGTKRTSPVLPGQSGKKLPAPVDKQRLTGASPGLRPGARAAANAATNGQGSHPSTGNNRNAAVPSTTGRPAFARGKNNAPPGQTAAGTGPTAQNTGIAAAGPLTAQAGNLLYLKTPAALWASREREPAGLQLAPKPLNTKDITGTDIGKKASFPRKPARKGFEVGLTLGPDFNVAPSMKYGKVGVNMGLLVNYHLNNRWFFTTGAVYSKKIYGATRSDYTTDPNTAYPIKKVEADCDVLDVPLNVNYTFLDRLAYTLSATAGISSYFMLKEKYDYYYYNYGPRKKTINNENRHYLSVLNAGVTYQRQVGSRLKLGVQPYVKIPVKGVGAGEVRLYSAGVSLQLNFTGKR